MTLPNPTARSASPQLPSGYSTPPPPPAGAVPTDFRSSLAAWWSNTSYKEARIAEERLLRRMAHFQPAPPEQAEKGWFSWTSSTSNPSDKAGQSSLDNAPTQPESPTATAADLASANQRQGEQVSQPIPIEGTKLVATLRNVFITTPNPLAAPRHPADPIAERDVDSPPASASSSTSSLGKCEKKAGKRREGKMVDYINTLEISRAEDKEQKEAVVVLHGYAAALG